MNTITNNTNKTDDNMLKRNFINAFRRAFESQNTDYGNKIYADFSGKLSDSYDDYKESIIFDVSDTKEFLEDLEEFEELKEKNLNKYNKEILETAKFYWDEYYHDIKEALNSHFENLVQDKFSMIEFNAQENEDYQL